MIEAKRTVGADKAGVLYCDDEVGRSNFEAVVAAFTEAGIARTSGVAVKRGAKLEQASIDALTKDGPHYVLATTQYSVVGDQLKAAGDKGTSVPVAALSFVNPDELAESVGPLARGMLVSQVIVHRGQDAGHRAEEGWPEAHTRKRAGGDGHARPGRPWWLCAQRCTRQPQRQQLGRAAHSVAWRWLRSVRAAVGLQPTLARVGSRADRQLFTARGGS